LVREIKKSRNDFIKEKGFTKYKFSWQEGYGAFSYSHSNLSNVVSYISNQKEHHKKKHLKKSIWSFYKKMKLILKMNIYLNG